MTNLGKFLVIGILVIIFISLSMGYHQISAKSESIEPRKIQHFVCYHYREPDVSLEAVGLLELVTTDDGIIELQIQVGENEFFIPVTGIEGVPYLFEEIDTVFDTEYAYELKLYMPNECEIPKYGPLADLGENKYPENVVWPK